MVTSSRKIWVVLGTVLVVGLLFFGWWSNGQVIKEESLTEVAPEGLVVVLEEKEGGLTVGGVKEYELLLESGEKTVSGINILMELDSKFAVFEKAEVDESTFDTVMKNEIEGGGGRLLISAVNMRAMEELPRGRLVVAWLRLKGLARGSSYVVLLPETYAVEAGSGENNQLGLRLKEGEVVIK